MCTRKLRKQANRGRFCRDENGAITVESVLWVPVFLLFFALIADVSLIFHGQAKALRIAYDGNRQASLGELASATDTQAAILARIQEFAPNATVNTSFGTDDIETRVVLPTNDLVAVGTITRVLNIDLKIQSIHMRDPEV